MNKEEIAVKEALEKAFLILCPVQFSIHRISDEKSLEAYEALLEAIVDFDERLGGRDA